MKNKLNIFNLIIVFLSALVLLFIIAPLTGMVLSTSFPSIVETTQDVEVQNSILITLLTAFAATIVFAIAGVPFAYFLSRKDFPGKQLVLGIINLPIVIPHTAAGIAVLGFISRDSIPGKIADTFGYSLVGSPAGISLAMAFVSVPFLLNAARDGFAGVPVRLEKAALNLGASPARVFFTISLPLAWRNIVSGAIMMFARGMSEFGAVIIVAYHPMITPVLIYERFSTFGLKYAQPVAVIFILVTLVFFVALRLVAIKKQ
ncbi:MAG: molybdenum ABC transporter permease [Bacteroidetes bacterium 4484_249]|nr:MAG: molybdenum ABC transporter permease [Bacteroidetes bacterium 4484_249]